VSGYRKCGAYSKSSVRKGTNAVGEGVGLSLRVIACPLEHFDAIGFLAHRVEDFAVAYALESGAHQSDSQHVAGRIYVIFLYMNFQNFCWR
jgi:hypothetical protein